jgi:hypothetical protein
MQVVTEFINFQLESPVTLEDMSVDGQIWRQILDDLLSQQGCLEVYWSRHVESSDWVVIRIGEWRGSSNYLLDTHLTEPSQTGILRNLEQSLTSRVATEI